MIRLRNFATLFPNCRELIGYSIQLDGDDGIIPANDPKLKTGSSDVLVADPEPTLLAAENYEKIADRFVGEYLWDLAELRRAQENRRAPQDAIDGDTRSKLKCLLDVFAFTPQDQLRGALGSRILPFMHFTMGADFVWPVRESVSTAQEWLSLNKMLLVAERFGAQRVQELVLERKVLWQILPDPFNSTAYLDAMLMLAPYAISLPFDRAPSQLHFLRNGLWDFPVSAFEGIYEMCCPTLKPLTEMEVLDPLNPRVLTGELPRSWFAIAVKALNHLLRYLRDSRNFVDTSGALNYLKVVQAYAVVHLLFSDLMQINIENTPPPRQRACFAFLDKLANLTVSMSTPGAARTEEEIFKEFFSSAYGSQLSNDLRRHFVAAEAATLGDIMAAAVTLVYEKIHARANAALGGGSTENSRTQYLRTLRNTHHGTFLRRQGFENAFLNSSATIPPEIIYLPLFLAWQLAFEPIRFLGP